MDRNAHHHSHPHAQQFFEAPRPKPDPSQRSFKELHHPLIRAIWNVDRLNPNVQEKLKELNALLEVHNPNSLCDILHEITGKPIAQATPLIIACFEGDPDVISLLIESNADVNQYESEHHLTPLHVICDAEYEGQNLTQKERADLVRLLIRKNALVNHLDRNAMAALHKAVIHDRPECIEELMQAKADPNVIYMGDTPLSIAARHNREKICRILCNYAETNINHRNEQNGTPLHYAAAAVVDDPTCIDLLLHKGAKVNATDTKNNTPLMVSAFFNKPNIMRYLISQGADVTVRNDEDKDAFDVADEKEHDECKEILIKEFEKLGINKTDRESELSRHFEQKNSISF